MYKSHSRQHIYTFVIGKKCTTALSATLVGIAVLTASLGLAGEAPELYKSMYGACHRFFLGSESIQERIATVGMPEPDIGTIMQTASPMLYAPSDKSEKVPVKPDAPEPESEHSGKLPAANVPAEKAIVSENMEFKNETDYTFDLHQMSTAQTAYSATGNEPRVLIVHTHACETYSDNNGRGIGKAGTYRSTDNSLNMVRVGKKIADNLRSSGINVIHDTTQCDYPSYNNAYKNSLEVISGYLNKYPSIRFVFDIHRDAITNSSNAPIKLTYDTGKEKAAQIMIVCGTDAMGLYHPNWRDNLTLASKIQLCLEKDYPGIARPVNVRRERFNMHTTRGSLIFEIGTHGNTLDEALASADILSEALEKVLTNKV